jgi:hypothetical protein
MHRPGLKSEGLVHLVKQRYGLVFAGLLIFALACTGPVTAAPLPVICQNVITLNEGDSIVAAVGNVCDGGTIILNPGTYSQHDITISKSLTIRANTSYGGTAANTIIDAQSLGRIFDNTGGHALTIGSLALRNGNVGGGGIAVYGGAIYASGGTITISSSTITDCSASGGGAIGIWSGTLIITSSTIAGCSATNGPGGALLIQDSAASISSSTISGCTASNGGAIYNYGTLAVTTSTLSGCSASVNGGAISSSRPLTITSSTFTGNTAGAAGSAIYSTGSGSSVHFSRFYQNLYPVWGVVHSPTSVEAQNNWWGTNDNPVVQTAGYVNDEPWLVLGANATPASITTARTSLITANLSFNSPAGTDTSPSGHIPDGTPVTFAVVTGGSVSPAATVTAQGVAHTVFTPSGAGTATISVTVDGQTVFITLPVSPPPTLPVVTQDTSGNDDGFPAATVAPTATGESAPPTMTVTVNIGGDSKAWQAVVTGTKLSGLIVTGNVQHGPGSNMTVPPAIVFQYIRLEPARYNSITKALINFTVPQSWLDEKHIDKKSIVLYHQTSDGGWEALPTTVLSTKDGTVYFSAQSTGFSLFAIAGTPTIATPAITTVATFGSVVEEQATTRAIVTKVVVTTETTAPPAATPQPAAPSPLLNIVLALAAIGMLAGCGFMARRWWIRRQNPALFEEC